MQIHHYSHPTTPAGPGSDTVISGAVQIDAAHKFTAAAAVGDSSIVGVKVDDDDAIYDFKGLWRWYVIENACPSDDHYAWNGYVGKQKISRGEGTSTLIPDTTGRRWDLELSELSTLAGRRVISGDDGNRPAETIAARLTWLIGTVYLPVSDNGLIVYDTTALDANDYRGQRASAVISDMAVLIGFNWWIYYDQAAADGDEVSLAFFHPDSDLYTSDLKISNVDGDEDKVTIFYPDEDAELERDPQKLAPGVYLPYSGGAVYEYDYSIAYEFGFQDQVAPTASIKTEAKAIALADHFIADNNEQDERVTTMRIHLPAAKLNIVKHGQRMQLKMQNWPGWEDYRWCRVVRKTQAPPDNKSQNIYDVDLELSPIRAQPSGAFGYHIPGAEAIPILPSETTPGNTLFMVVTGSSVITAPLPPVTPHFTTHLELVSPTPDLDWTEHVFEYAGVAGTTFVMAAMYSRPVRVDEVTTRPVAVGPAVEPHDKMCVYLWEIPGTHVPTDVTSVSTDDVGTLAEEEVIAMADALTGFAVGALSINISDYGHRIEVTPDVGETLESASGVNDGTAPGTLADYPPPGHYGVDVPWSWIGTTSDGAALAAHFTAPLDTYTNTYVAGVAVVIPGISRLPHINYIGESPPNVTTDL